jgi:hypothetical protein
MSDSFLKEVGRSYLFSSLLPTVFFGVIGCILFSGFIPSQVIEQIGASGDLARFQWIVLIILALWLSVYLYSSSNTTIRLFEGYFLLPKKSLHKITNTSRTQSKWEKTNLPKYKKWKELHNRISNDVILSEKEMQSFFSLILESLAEMYNVNQTEPLNVNSRMPTRLGNVFRASEQYAFERYFVINSVMWPRLLLILPPNMKKQMEDRNSLFMFLLNSALLSYLIAFLNLFFGVFGFLLPVFHLPRAFFHIGYDFIAPLSYIAFAIVFTILGYFLYRIAVSVAIEVSLDFRLGFDLYRTDLLREFSFEPPNTFEEEKFLWLELTKLIVAGDRFPADFSAFTRIVRKPKGARKKLEDELS